MSARYRACRSLRKSIFCFSMKGFPEDNEFDCLHTQEMCVSVCMLSSFYNRQHFDGDDSTMINVSLLVFQSLCSSVSVSTTQSIRDNLEVSSDLLPLETQQKGIFVSCISRRSAPHILPFTDDDLYPPQDSFNLQEMKFQVYVNN